MAAYKFLDEVDTNRVFVVNRSELEGRFEPEYYKPSISNMENIIRLKAEKKLRDYIIRISSGATPYVTEEDKYYGNPENGIPFLRVQNLQTNGKLNLKDLKYINKETHENYLKRSQVYEGDLLVKITGVGRMAIASVAPPNFVGNTNQHMVVIKTKDKSISEYLANYLNLDIIEKLASRRSTGATRPALDYPALKSIPIIENIDFSIIVEAEKLKQQKEQEAERLLAGIDAYLLQELGVTLPEQEKSLQSRIFTVNFSEVTGGRFDPFTIFTDDFKIEGGVYPNKKLWKIAEITKGQSITSKHVIEGEYPVIAGGKTSPYTHNKYNFQGNVITVSASGAYSGYAWYHTKPIFASDCSVIWSKNENELLTLYLAEVLKAKQKEIYNLQQGAGQPHVYPNDLAKLNIPTPEMAKQKEIADTISKLRAKVKQLKKEAKRLLEDAKKEVEQLILGE
jgi:restriction endonuclease S subunit